MFARRAPWLLLSLVGGSLVALGVGGGCGAQGQEAPYVVHPHQNEDQCLGGEQALAATREQLKDDALEGLGPHVEQILVEEGGLRVVIPGMLLAARAIGLENALSLTKGYQDGEGLARLKPHLLRVVHYLTGDSPYIEGEHYAVVDAVHRVVTGQGQGCDHLAALGAFRRLLLLEVQGASGEPVRWLDEAGDALVDLVEDPVFQEQLDRFAFSDDGGQGSDDVVVGREAYQLVMRLATSNVAQDSFDIEVVRGLLEDLLVFQLPDDSAARAKALRVVDVFATILEPELDAFPYLQSTLKCVNDVDEEGQIWGVLFDYLSIEELNLAEFVRDVDATAGEEAGESLRLFFSDGVAAMEGQPVLSRDTLAVMNRFIEPHRSRDVLGAFLQLEGTGVFSELIGYVERMIRTCDATDLDAVAPEGEGG